MTTNPQPERMSEAEIKYRIDILERRLQKITPPMYKAELYEADMLRADIVKLKAMLP